MEKIGRENWQGKLVEKGKATKLRRRLRVSRGFGPCATTMYTPSALSRNLRSLASPSCSCCRRGRADFVCVHARVHIYVYLRTYIWGASAVTRDAEDSGRCGLPEKLGDLNYRGREGAFYQEECFLFEL